MGQFSNSFPKHFSYLCEYAIRFDLSCSFCEYPFIFHCLHCSPSCFDPDSLLLAYLWLGLSWIDCISANKSFSSPKTSSRKPYTSSKQQERQKHSVETTINFSQPPYSHVENSTRAELDPFGLTALRAMVDVEPYGSSDLGRDPSDDEPPSMTFASPSEEDDPDDTENPSGRKKKKIRKTKRPEGSTSQEAKAIATLKIVVNLPEFRGKDLSKFAENFGRCLRMTGPTRASGRVKCDLLLQCCKTKYLEKQVKQILTKSATFADVLVALKRQYPTYETNLSIRAEIQNLAVLPNNPKPAMISELLVDLDYWVGRLTPGSYGSDELLFW